MRTEEHQEQVALIGWCDAVASAYPDVGQYAAFPNGGYRDPRTAKALKREGVRAGMPDLFWPVPRNGSHGLFIEMKRRKGWKISDPQKERIAYLRSVGYAVHVCAGCGEAIDVLAAYFGIRVSWSR